MRILYLLVTIYVVLILSSCTSINNPSNSLQSNKHPASPTAQKDPINVSFLTIKKPLRPYQIIGKTIVAKYNVVGIKRQEATLRDLLRQQAALLGGDAIINIQHSENSIVATVIAYKQVLV